MATGFVVIATWQKEDAKYRHAGADQELRRRSREGKEAGLSGSRQHSSPSGQLLNGSPCRRILLPCGHFVRALSLAERRARR